MRSIVKSDFFWPFAGGFLLGTIGLFAMQPADSPYGLTHGIAGIVHHQH